MAVIGFTLTKSYGSRVRMDFVTFSQRWPVRWFSGLGIEELIFIAIKNILFLNTERGTLFDLLKQKLQHWSSHTYLQ